jgi:transposase InsO family protein
MHIDQCKHTFEELAAFLTLRLLTARGGEVDNMRWSDVDWAGRVWTIPGEFAKNGEHEQPIAANVLDRQFAAERPNQRWVSDTSEFVIAGSAKLYLAAILDL